MDHLSSTGAHANLLFEGAQLATATISTSANEALQQRVRLFLTASNLPGLRHVDVEVQGDTVILRGQLRTFYEKQLAARLSHRVAGVIHVVDLIEVRGYVPQVEPGSLHNSRQGRTSPRPR